VRLFGLPYAHPHPKDPATWKIRNQAGLPLPTELTGEPVADALIDREEQALREARMKRLCVSCHGSSWVDGHFDRLDNTIDTANRNTLAATQILLHGWEKGVANPDDSLFNDPLELMWVQSWLFYANSIRFSSAMAGADYGVFANGRWVLHRHLAEMKAMLAK
jgi:hypothetical protein